MQICQGVSSQVLILGATGGCGRKALAELLSRGGVAVTAVVRSESRLPPDLVGHDNLSVVVAPDGHLALSEFIMKQIVNQCPLGNFFMRALSDPPNTEP